MDKCRISWGKVVKEEKDKIRVKTQELVYEDGRLRLNDEVEKEVSWRLGDKSFVKGLKKGDWVTVHWDWVCEKVSQKQVRNLEKYTKWHLRLANTTI
jgi:hydrogenase maturation factor